MLLPNRSVFVEMFSFQYTFPNCLRGKRSKKLRNHAVSGSLIIAFLASAGMLSACSSLSRPLCAQGERSFVQDMLYFGTASPIGNISPGKWSGFLRITVTPRFPQGFSSWQGNGQWRSADGTIQHELTYILSLVHPADNFSERAVREIIDQYKQQFRQESVLRVKFQVCVSI